MNVFCFVGLNGTAMMSGSSKAEISVIHLSQIRFHVEVVQKIRQFQKSEDNLFENAKKWGGKGEIAMWEGSVQDV